LEEALGESYECAYVETSLYLVNVEEVLGESYECAYIGISLYLVDVRQPSVRTTSMPKLRQASTW
jgi:hypothetical protein